MYINRDKFNCFSLAEISETDWNSIISLGTVKTVKASAMLYEQGMEISELACITEGTVKIVHLFDNGNEKLYEHLHAPSFIGAEALWNNGGKSFYPTVIALTDVTVSEVPIETAESFISNKPDIIISMFQCIRNVMCANRIRSVCAIPMSMLQKAAFAITFMRAPDKDDEGYVTVTHEELANLIGISRANLTTALAELTERGIICKKRGRLKIVDNDALTELLNIPF
ncbi:MAG: Crp/Fnr family transcriptional regulator [Clostridiales bacterium]|nr:Crp/Fnr family transcriptional regulator [Clostridiales bacterium]